MDDRAREWNAKVWRINAALNMPDLDPEAVLVAIMDSDPLERYREALRKSLDILRQQVARETDPLQRELVRKAQMTSTWDRLFSAVPGDQVYLLTAPRRKDGEIQVRTLAFASNAPAGRKWFVSKIAYLKDHPVCWSIPLDTETGKAVDAHLKPDNTLDLQKQFDAIVTPE